MRRLRYLALGDSYTFGTGAGGRWASFPSLLAGRLEAAAGIRVEVRNPAVNGFTTADLIAHELCHLARFEPDRVSVLIGANDVAQRLDGGYRGALGRIYDAIAARIAAPRLAAAISVPDWSGTPAAPDFGEPAEIRGRLAAVNQAAREEAAARGFVFVDIVDLSRRDPAPAGWLAADGLHPGPAQYAAWAERIWGELAGSWV